jgi:phage terminase large subunit GpA-like protein
MQDQLTLIPDDMPDDIDPDILDSWCNGLRPAPQLTVSQWAEEHRVLDKKTSAEPGGWRNSRTPYLVEIMDCLSQYHPATEVWFMKGSQVGGTEVGNNWLGYLVHHSPSPILVIYPRVDDSKNTSKIRLDSLLEDTPALSELIKPARSRDSGNTTLVKEFPGGVLKLVGANSAAGLKSMAAKAIFGDEVDEYPADVQGQGDPIALAEVRSRTFGATRKAFYPSSPTVKGVSRIERGFEETDQRRYFVPCPDCGHMQVLVWSGMTWEADKKTGLPIFESVRYRCEACEFSINEHHKTRMLADGEWRATAVASDPGKVGFHLSALYSPVGWYSWEHAVRDFWNARIKQKQGNPDLMKVFVNTVEGRTWEDSSNAVDHDTLSQRSEPITVVPAGGLLLTAGVDTQDNRLAVEILAWGRGEECWILHYDELHGDPARPEVWGKLDEVLARTWTHEFGAELHVVSVAIDSGGHKTQEVYRYARTHFPRMIAIKGQGEDPGKPTTGNRPILGAPTPQDVDYGGQKIKDGVLLWPVGTNTGYGIINSRLRLAEPGPGFIHMPGGQDDEFFKQLTSMKEVTEFKRGIPRKTWVQQHRRREVLHCLIYGYAAAVRAGVTRQDWDALEQSVKNYRNRSAGRERRFVKSSIMG